MERVSRFDWESRMDERQRLPETTGVQWAPNEASITIRP